MKRFLPLFFLPGLAAAQMFTPAAPTLTVAPVHETIVFDLAANTPFLGAVVVSLNPNLVYYFAGLPPVLADFTVLGLGFADAHFLTATAASNAPVGVQFHAQGLVLTWNGLDVTKVVDFARG